MNKRAARNVSRLISFIATSFLMLVRCTGPGYYQNFAMPQKIVEIPTQVLQLWTAAILSDQLRLSSDKMDRVSQA